MARKSSKRRKTKPESQGNVVPALLLMALGAFAAAPFYRSQHDATAIPRSTSERLDLRQTVPMQIQPRVPIADYELGPTMRAGDPRGGAGSYSRRGYAYP